MKKFIFFLILSLITSLNCADSVSKPGTSSNANTSDTLFREIYTEEISADSFFTPEELIGLHDGILPECTKIPDNFKVILRTAIKTTLDDINKASLNKLLSEFIFYPLNQIYLKQSNQQYKDLICYAFNGLSYYANKLVLAKQKEIYNKPTLPFSSSCIDDDLSEYVALLQRSEITTIFPRKVYLKLSTGKIYEGIGDHISKISGITAEILNECEKVYSYITQVYENVSKKDPREITDKDFNFNLLDCKKFKPSMWFNAAAACNALKKYFLNLKLAKYNLTYSDDNAILANITDQSIAEQKRVELAALETKCKETISAVQKYAERETKILKAIDFKKLTSELMGMLIFEDQDPSTLNKLLARINDKDLIRGAIENVIRQLTRCPSNIKLILKIYEENGGKIESLSRYYIPPTLLKSLPSDE